MKRSEAISKLGEHMSKWERFEGYLDPYTILDFVEEVLKMEPPFRSNGLTGIAAQIEGTGSNTWEPEDD